MVWHCDEDLTIGPLSPISWHSNIIVLSLKRAKEMEVLFPDYGFKLVGLSSGSFCSWILIAFPQCSTHMLGSWGSSRMKSIKIWCLVDFVLLDIQPDIPNISPAIQFLFIISHHFHPFNFNHTFISPTKWIPTKMCRYGRLGLSRYKMRCMNCKIPFLYIWFIVGSMGIQISVYPKLKSTVAIFQILSNFWLWGHPLGI